MEDKRQSRWLRILYYDYRSEIFFGVVLLALTILSYWLGAYIPEEVFENIINPIEYVSTACVCFSGFWVMLRHHEGMLIRKSWAGVLFLWGCIDVALIAFKIAGINIVGGTPDDLLFNASVTLGCVLAGMLYIYPAQALHPAYLTWWRVLLLVIPLIIIGIVDYIVPANLLPVIMIYPVIIFLALCSHIRSYRQWCEENYSSMDKIEVQWLVRYLTMLAIAGLAFYFIVFRYVPNRMFTQQWLLLLILFYTTEQVLFRKDPWEELRSEGVEESGSEGVEKLSSEAPMPNEEQSLRAQLEQWMATEKPYRNPDFRLDDLRQVLPLNRTYLSQFINSEYGYSFYQWVNRYRMEEAQHLMTDHPEMKLADVASSCGYSSLMVFSRTFARETGLSPRDWSKSRKTTR